MSLDGYFSQSTKRPKVSNMRHQKLIKMTKICVYSQWSARTAMSNKHHYHQTGSVLRRLIVASKNWSPTHTHTYYYILCVHIILVKLWQFCWTKRRRDNNTQLSLNRVLLVRYVLLAWRCEYFHKISVNSHTSVATSAENHARPMRSSRILHLAIFKKIK